MRTDRGFLENRRGRTAGLEETGALRSRVSEEQTRADRGFEAHRCCRVAGKIGNRRGWSADNREKYAAGSQLGAGKARSGRS